MTASTIAPVPSSLPGTVDRALAGARPLIRKEAAEWRHSRRVWVILAVSTLFMALSAANSAINAWVIANLPADATVSREISMVPLDNMLMAAGSQIFILAAIFAAMSLLIVERDRGTLAWVASKPIGRPAIWFAKWVAGSAAVAITAVVIPVVVTALVIVVLYGVPAVVPVIAITVGMIAAVAFFVAVSLAVSTVVGSQAAVAAVGFAVFFLPTVLVAIVPFDIGPFLPTSIVGWAIGLAMGAPVGVVTPIAWVVSLVALGVVAGRRMEVMEL